MGLGPVQLSGSFSTSLYPPGNRDKHLGRTEGYILGKKEEASRLPIPASPALGGSGGAAGAAALSFYSIHLP